MPSPINITNIPAPRVDFIDPRTGLMSREWYRFFFNLFNLTGAGTNDTSLTDLQIGPPVYDLTGQIAQISDSAQLAAMSDQAEAVLGQLGIVYDQAQLASMIAQYEQATLNLQNQFDTAPAAPQLGTIASYNLNGSPTAGGVGYGTGSAVAFTPAGTSGQFLTSAAAGTPTWTTPSSVAVTSFSAGTTGLTPSTATTGAVTLAGTLAATNGGTGQSTYTLGDTLYSSAANTLAKLAGNITATKQFLSQTGTGTVSAAPVWSAVSKSDVGLGNVENTALSTWAGSTNITTLGTVATGTWSATTIAANKGGTGQTAYAIGDLLYANTASTLAKLADVATGNALISGGVGVAPAWGKIGLTTHVSGTLAATNGGTGQSSYAVGDLLYASTTTVLSRLAAATSGLALITNGLGVAPSYGKIGLTTHVNGTLLPANGGTGFNTYTIGDILYANSVSTMAKLAGVATGNALISGGVGVAPSYGKIGLTTHVSGTLPVTNGGTGTATALTPGSVVFAGASGVYSEDTINFFWDATNIFLGLGTNVPTHTLTTASYSQGSTSQSFVNIKIKDLWGFAESPEPGVVFSGYTDATTESALGSISVLKVNTTSGNAASTMKFVVSTATPGTHVTAMQIASDGYAQCNGVKFPATQAASADANTLDDYEEGNWTPTIVGGTTAGAGTYTVQVGRYTKIGRNVTITGRVTWTAHTGTGAMRIGGLPFTSMNVANVFASVTFGYINNVVYTAANTPMGYVNTNSTQILLVQMPSGGGAMANVNMDTAGDYIFSCTYMV